MPSDRKSLSLYETPEALALLEGKWPEWVAYGRRHRLVFRPPDGADNRPTWRIELHDGEGWILAQIPDNHTALCILRDHLRVVTEAAAITIN